MLAVHAIRVVADGNSKMHHNLSDRREMYQLVWDVAQFHIMTFILTYIDIS